MARIASVASSIVRLAATANLSTLLCPSRHRRPPPTPMIVLIEFPRKFHDRVVLLAAAVADVGQLYKRSIVLRTGVIKRPV